MKTSIATVSISGSLVEKLHACADAGFDGVEIFEPDLIASDHSPEEIRGLARRLGLSLDLYQPLRDIEGVDEATFAENLRRAGATFATAQRLGIDTVLVCSNVATATVDSDEHSAEQLRRLGDVAARYDVQVAFEALAWGRFVDDYRRAWRIVELADHPAVGVCLDSFHVLSRGHDPAAIEDIPGRQDLLPPTRRRPRALHGRAVVEPAPPAVPRRRRPSTSRRSSPTCSADRLRRAAVAGGLQRHLPADRPGPDRRARPALAGVVAGQGRRAAREWRTRASLTPVADAKPPIGFDFVELKAEDTSDVEVLLEQLGFTPSGRHRTKPVSLWAAGDVRIVLNEQQARDLAPHVAAVGLQVPDADATSRRAADLMAPRGLPADLRRRTSARRRGRARRHRDSSGSPRRRPARRRPGSTSSRTARRRRRARSVRIDHVNLAQPWQTADEAVLFLTSVFGLAADAPTEVRGPSGLVRSQVMRTADGSIRLPLNVAPHVLDDGRHAAARRVRLHRRRRRRPAARARGLRFLAGAGQLLRLRGGPIRRRRGHGRRTARARPALRPQPRRRRSCTSTPAPSGRCSSNSSSASAITTATAPTTRPCGWPPSGCALPDSPHRAVTPPGTTSSVR